MTTWRRLFGATLLVAAIAAAGAATDGQDQGLDVPWEGIVVASQQRVREVTEHAIFSRDLHGIQVRCLLTVFDVLRDHPDFAATAGKILGTVKYRIVKGRDGVFWGDDAHGATGTFDKRLLPTVQKTLVSQDL